ncbi:MAG: DUF3137 domain-containing protein [Methylacidiphilales bacterium]|nr:DUF3137 domain-containing protein [Candidatus Methylacidiphilales bacterium]
MGYPMLCMIAAVLILIVVGSIYGAIQAKKRREGLSELAQRVNLNFKPDPDYELAERFGFLKKLAKGDNRFCYNVLSGKYQGDDVLAFDYHYQVTTHDKNGSHTTHYRFSFFILQMAATFPDLTIRRESFFLKVAEVFGYQDIKFESAEFSKTFCVRSPDKKFAYDVCNAQMMDYLLANRDLSLEIENQALALAFDACLTIEQIESDLKRLVEIRSLLPGYLFTNA